MDRYEIVDGDEVHTVSAAEFRMKTYLYEMLQGDAFVQVSNMPEGTVRRLWPSHRVRLDTPGLSFTSALDPIKDALIETVRAALPDVPVYEYPPRD